MTDRTHLTRRGFVSMLASMPLIAVAQRTIFLPPARGWRPWILDSRNSGFTLSIPGVLRAMPIEPLSLDGLIISDSVALIPEFKVLSPDEMLAWMRG